MNDLYISNEFLRFFRHEARIFIYIKNKRGRKLNKIDVFAKRKTMISEYSFEIKNITSGNCSDFFYADGYYVFPVKAIEVFKGYNKIELSIHDVTANSHDDIYGLLFFYETKELCFIYVEFTVALFAFMFSYIFYLVIKRMLSVTGNPSECAHVFGGMTD